MIAARAIKRARLARSSRVVENPNIQESGDESTPQVQEITELDREKYRAGIRAWAAQRAQQKAARMELAPENPDDGTMTPKRQVRRAEKRRFRILSPKSKEPHDFVILSPKSKRVPPKAVLP